MSEGFIEFFNSGKVDLSSAISAQQVTLQYDNRKNSGATERVTTTSGQLLFLYAPNFGINSAVFYPNGTVDCIVHSSYSGASITNETTGEVFTFTGSGSKVASSLTFTCVDGVISTSFYLPSGGGVTSTYIACKLSPRKCKCIYRHFPSYTFERRKVRMSESFPVQNPAVSSKANYSVYEHANVAVGCGITVIVNLIGENPVLFENVFPVVTGTSSDVGNITYSLSGKVLAITQSMWTSGRNYYVTVYEITPPQ